MEPVKKPVCPPFLPQGLPDGPGELSFGHDASPVSGPVGFGTTWQVPTRRRGFQYGTPAQLLWSFSWKLLAKANGSLGEWITRPGITQGNPRSHGRNGCTNLLRLKRSAQYDFATRKAAKRRAAVSFGGDGRGGRTGLSTPVTGCRGVPGTTHGAAQRRARRGPGRLKPSGVFPLSDP